MSEITSQHKAYAAIKEGILTLRARPLSHLKAVDIAEQLKMSRTPVREALVRLEQDGLVQRVDAGGFQVRPISLKEIVDVYRVREAIEVEAALQTVKYVDDVLIKRLGGFLEEASALLKPETYAEFVAANRKFHAEIIRASRNSFAEKIMQPINDRVRLVGAMLIKMHAPRQKEVLVENRKIFAALKARDPDELEKAVRLHVTRAREHATALFSRSQEQIYVGVDELRP